MTITQKTHAKMAKSIVREVSDHAAPKELFALKVELATPIAFPRVSPLVRATMSSPTLQRAHANVSLPAPLTIPISVVMTVAAALVTHAVTAMSVMPFQTNAF